MSDREKRLREYILNNIDYTGHWCKVESPNTSAGIPDLNYFIDMKEGWLELKQGASPRNMPHIRPTQIAWFRRRVATGGKPRLLFKIDDTFGLIAGDKVGRLVNATNKIHWVNLAYLKWEGGINWDELIAELKDT